MSRAGKEEVSESLMEESSDRLGAGNPGKTRTVFGTLHPSTRKTPKNWRQIQNWSIRKVYEDSKSETRSYYEER